MKLNHKPIRISSIILIILLSSSFILSLAPIAGATPPTQPGYNQTPSSNTSCSSSPCTKAFTSNVQSGDLVATGIIITAGTINNKVTISSITDSLSCSSYTRIVNGSYLDTSSYWHDVEIWACNPTSTGSDTITVNFNTGGHSFSAYWNQFDINNVNKLITQTAIATGTGTNFATSNTPFYSGYAFTIGVIAATSAGTITANSSYIGGINSASYSVEYSTGVNSATNFQQSGTTSTGWIDIGAAFMLGVTQQISITFDQAKGGGVPRNQSLSFTSSTNCFSTITSLVPQTTTNTNMLAGCQYLLTGLPQNYAFETGAGGTTCNSGTCSPVTLTYYKLPPNISNIGTSNGYALEYSTSHQEMCYSNSRYWLFFWDGANYGFVSSSDANTWSGETTITTAGFKSVSGIAIACSGTKILRAIQSNLLKKIYYDTGTTSSSGAISWGTESYITTAGYVAPSNELSASIDKSGNLWVAMGTNANSAGGGNWCLEVWEYITSWTTNFPSNCNTVSQDYDVEIISTTDGNVNVVWNYLYLSSDTFIQYYAGGGWSGIYNDVKSVTAFGGGHAFADGTYVIYIENSGNILYWTQFSSGIYYQTDTNIYGTTSNYPCLFGCAISGDGAANVFAYFTEGDTGGVGNSLYYMSSSNDGTTWNNPVLVQTITIQSRYEMVSGLGNGNDLVAYIASNTILVAHFPLATLLPITQLETLAFSLKEIPKLFFGIQELLTTTFKFTIASPTIFTGMIEKLKAIFSFTVSPQTFLGTIQRIIIIFNFKEVPNNFKGIVINIVTDIFKWFLFPQLPLNQQGVNTTQGQPINSGSQNIALYAAFLWLFPLFLGGLFGLTGAFIGLVLSLGLGTIAGIIPTWMVVLFIALVTYIIIKRSDIL